MGYFIGIFGWLYITPIVLSPFIAKLAARFAKRALINYAINNKQINHYKIIGVEIGTNFQNIRKKYNEIAINNHPDKRNIYSEFDESKFAEITDSYNELKHKHKNNELNDYSAFLKMKTELEESLKKLYVIVNYFDLNNTPTTVIFPIIITLFWPLLVVITTSAILYNKINAKKIQEKRNSNDTYEMQNNYSQKNINMLDYCYYC